MKATLKGDSGQALIETSFAMVTLIVLVLGIVDFGRAIYDVQVMKNLAGEGSSLASRGLDVATTAQNVATDAGSTINIGSNGCVIVTTVTNQGGTLAVTDQAYNCALSTRSQVGCVKGVGGCQSSTPSLPSAAQTALSAECSGCTVSVTEIYYNYSPITPITRLLGSGAIPSQLYTAAYY